jgi:hypothetical protein
MRHTLIEHMFNVPLFNFITHSARGLYLYVHVAYLLYVTDSIVTLVRVRGDQYVCFL